MTDFTEFDMASVDALGGAVLGIEEYAHSQGHIDAISMAQESGIYEEGIRGGVMKGLAIGIELGYNQIVIEKVKSQETMKNIRQLKKCETLENKLNAIPNFNDDSIDFDNTVRDVRSLSRALLINNPIMPPFQPPSSFASKTSASDW